MTTTKLLKTLEATFSVKKKKLQAQYRKMGIFENPEFSCFPAESMSLACPTFANGKTRPWTPMLKARFEYCGAISLGPERWLAISEITEWLVNNEVLAVHQALRENWPDSVPARFQDDSISLFGVVPDVPDSLVYLAWPGGNTEPIVAQYSSFQDNEFRTLDEFLEWQIG